MGCVPANDDTSVRRAISLAYQLKFIHKTAFDVLIVSPNPLSTKVRISAMQLCLPPYPSRTQVSQTHSQCE